MDERLKKRLMENESMDHILEQSLRKRPIGFLENLVPQIKERFAEIYMTVHDRYLNREEVNVRIWGGFPKISGHDMRPDWFVNREIAIAEAKTDSYESVERLAERLGAQQVGSIERSGSKSIYCPSEVGPLVVYRIK